MKKITILTDDEFEKLYYKTGRTVVGDLVTSALSTGYSIAFIENGKSIFPISKESIEKDLKRFFPSTSKILIDGFTRYNQIIYVAFKEIPFANNCTLN